MYHNNICCRHLLTAYFISVTFQTLFDWPVIGEKVQLPEIIFLLLAGYIGFFRHRAWFDFVKSKIGHPLVKAIGWYALAFLGTNLVVGQYTCWIEWVGLLYLIAVFLTVWWIGQSSDFFDWITRAFTWMGVAAAAAGLALWAGAIWFPDSTWLVPNQMYYPSIGVVQRATGFTPTPNMLFSILVASLLVRFMAVHWQEGAKHKAHWLTGILVAGAVATFAKQWLLLVATGLLMGGMVLGNARWRGWSFFAGLVGLCCFLFFSHVSILKKDFPQAALERAAYEFQLLVPDPIYVTSTYYVYCNSYALWKKTAVLAGLQRFPFGIGAGRHCPFIETLRAKGRYPSQFPCNDPHCAYTGAFGELGALGFVALLWMVWQIAVMARRTVRSAGRSKPLRGLALALAAGMLYFGLEALVVDTMNFRHLWLAMGVLAALEERFETQTGVNPNF